VYVILLPYYPIKHKWAHICGHCFTSDFFWTSWSDMEEPKYWCQCLLWCKCDFIWL